MQDKRSARCSVVANARRALAVAIALSAIPVTTLAAQSPPKASSAPIVRRYAPDSLWRRVWVVGSDSSSDTFVEPRQVSVTGDLVVVLDVGTREVHGLDARTGVTRFVLKPRGQGPGEFKRPAMLAASPEGFVVLDHANARLTAYDRTGRRAWDVVLDNIFVIDGLCVRSGPRVVVRLKRRDSSIVEYDTTGRRTAVRSFPWKHVPPSDPGFAYSAFTSDASRQGDCVVAPIFGLEWGVASSAGPLRVFGLKEPGVPAVVVTSERILQQTWTRMLVQGSQQSDTRHASRGALIQGDTAIVYAARTQDFPLKVLDYYNARTGDYFYSRRLPFTFNALTIGADGTFYGLLISPNEQAVIAMRPESPASSRPRRPYGNVPVRK